MAKTRLEKLKVTSVDLCKTGANQDAKIMLYKSADDDAKGGENDMNNMGFWERVATAIGKAMGVEPDAEIMEQIAYDATGYAIEAEIDAIGKALQESLHSIVNDETMTAEDMQDMIAKSIEECSETVLKAAKRWTGDDEDDDFEDVDEWDDEPEEENEEEDMNFDVNKMTPEDKASFDSLVNKYCVKKSADGAEVDPVVQKALDDVAELKKSLEIQQMKNDFAKYAVIGKSADDMANELYDLKKSNEQAYNSVIAAYDAMVTTTEQSGIFKEYGSNRGGDGSVNAKLSEAVANIQKAYPEKSYAQAVVMACDNNPELKAEVEGR